MQGLRLARELRVSEANKVLWAVRDGEVRRSKVLERPDGYSVVVAEWEDSIVIAWLRGNLRNLLCADVLRAEQWKPEGRAG